MFWDDFIAALSWRIGGWLSDWLSVELLLDAPFDMRPYSAARQHCGVAVGCVPLSPVVPTIYLPFAVHLMYIEVHREGGLQHRMRKHVRKKPQYTSENWEFHLSEIPVLLGDSNGLKFSGMNWARVERQPKPVMRLDKGVSDNTARSWLNGRASPAAAFTGARCCFTQKPFMIFLLEVNWSWRPRESKLRFAGDRGLILKIHWIVSQRSRKGSSGS